MSTRDQLNNAIYNGLRKNHQKLMSSVAINTGAVADHLLAKGWRPPMREITTEEELEALPVWTELIDADHGLIQKVDSPPNTFIRPGSMEHWYAHGIVNCGPFRVVWEPEEP